MVLRCCRFKHHSTFFAVNGIPTVKRALLFHLFCTLAGLIENMITVKKQFAGNILQTVCKHRHHIHFRIPEGLTAVHRARKSVCGNVRVSVAPRRLKHLKKRKTYPLLHERIVVDANIRIFPKFMQNVAAPVQKLVKPCPAPSRTFASAVAA